MINHQLLHTSPDASKPQWGKRTHLTHGLRADGPDLVSVAPSSPVCSRFPPKTGKTSSLSFSRPPESLDSGTQDEFVISLYSLLFNYWLLHPLAGASKPELGSQPI